MVYFYNNEWCAVKWSEREREKKQERENKSQYFPLCNIQYK